MSSSSLLSQIVYALHPSLVCDALLLLPPAIVGRRRLLPNRNRLQHRSLGFLYVPLFLGPSITAPIAQDFDKWDHFGGVIPDTTADDTATRH